MPRILVLNFETSTRIATCINRETKEVIRVKLEGDSEPSLGRFLNYETVRFDEYYKTFVLSADEFYISNATPIDSIEFTPSGIQIRSWIGFSDNPEHVTYDRKIGFTDWYGLVDCAGCFLDGPGIYGGYLEINDFDFEKNSTCLFKLIGEPVMYSHPSRPKMEFYEKMVEFEENVRKKNEKPHNKMDEFRVVAIVLSIEKGTNSAICFSRQLESKICIKLPQRNGIKKGNLISFSDYDYKNDVYFPNQKAGTIKIESDKSVRMMNSEILIRACAALSSVYDFNHRKDIAFAGCFGLVKVPSNIKSQMEMDIAYQVEISFTEAQGTDPIFTIATLSEPVPGHESGDFLAHMFKYGDSNNFMSHQTEPSVATSLSNDNSSQTPAMEESNISKQQQPMSSKNESKRNSEESENITTREDVPSKEPFKEFGADRRTNGCNPLPNNSSQEQISSKPSPSNGCSKTGHENRVSETMTEKLDKEYKVLVLCVTKIEIIGYETTELKLMKISSDNLAAELKPNQFQMLSFISNGSRNGLYDMKVGTANLTSSDLDFSGTEFVANVAFSANPKCKSFNMSVAFSDTFGYVRITNPDDTLKTDCIYRTRVILKQCENPLDPVFEAVSSLEKMDLDPKFTERFFQGMEKYEERMFHDCRNGGFSSNEMPFKPSTQKTNQSKKTFKKREPMENYHKGVVILTNTKAKYGELLTAFGNAVFPCTPSVPGFGTHIEEGSVILVRLEHRPYLCVKQVISFIHKLPLQMKDGGYVVEDFLSASQVSNVAPDVYFHDFCGYVLADGYLRRGDDGTKSPVHLTRQHRPITRNGTDVYWVATFRDDSRFNNPYNDSLSDQKTPQKKMMEQPENHYHQSSHYNYQSRPFGGSPGNSNGFQGTSGNYKDYNIAAESNRQHSPTYQNHGSTSSTYTSTRQCLGLVTRCLRTSNRRMYLMYLSINKAAIVYPDDFNNGDVQVQLGNVYDCDYEPIPISEKTAFAPFRVVNVYITETTNTEVKVDGHESLSLYEIDLSKVCSEFEDFTYRSGGRYIMNIPKIGLAVLKEEIRYGKSIRDANDVLKEFDGKSYADRMVAWCRYERCLVPLEMIDSNYKGDKDEYEYVWVIQEVLGTLEHYKHNQQEKKLSNLGPNNKEIEAEDQISREKRIAKEEFEKKNQEECGFSGASSVYSHHSPNYRSSDGYATPREPMRSHNRSSHSTYGPSSSKQYSHQKTVDELEDDMDRAQRCMSSLRREIGSLLNDDRLYEQLMSQHRDVMPRLLRALDDCKMSNDKYFRNK